MATRPLASAIAGTLLCLAITTAAAARDCRDETPLPPDVRLIAPAADVPADIARFAGVWVGPWKEAGADTLCATLVVEEVLPSGHARLVYNGTWAADPVPGHLQARDGRRWKRALRAAVIGRPPLAYRFTAGALAGRDPRRRPPRRRRSRPRGHRMPPPAAETTSAHAGRPRDRWPPPALAGPRRPPGPWRLLPAGGIGGAAGTLRAR
jgi:hypothetical protein